MKTCTLLFVIAIAVSANAQDKPRVFVQGKGSENVSSNGAAGGDRHWAAWGSKSTIDSHDESMEVTKNFQKDCSDVTVTINQREIGIARDETVYMAAGSHYAEWWLGLVTFDHGIGSERIKRRKT